VNVALDNQILRGVIGSSAHGISTDSSDRDEMGVFIETPEQVCGLEPMDNYTYRDQREGVRSGPSDLDLTLFSLRRFCKLAVSGNPSVTIMLWLPEYLIKTELGEELIGIREAFISTNAGRRYLGYLHSQKLKMLGEKARTVKRQDLIDTHGYDTKFACHALRIGMEGIDLMTQKKVIMPIQEPNLSILRGIRNGEWEESDVLEMITRVERVLQMVTDSFDWKPDTDRINKFLVRAHQLHWKENDTRYNERVHSFAK
jgi:predicted nucleotidyltransferase